MGTNFITISELGTLVDQKGACGLTGHYVIVSAPLANADVERAYKVLRSKTAGEGDKRKARDIIQFWVNA